MGFSVDCVSCSPICSQSHTVIYFFFLIIPIIIIHIPSTFLSKWDSCLASSDFNWDTVNVLWKQRKHYKLNHVELTWTIDAMWLVMHHYHDIRQLIKHHQWLAVWEVPLCLAVPTSEPHYSKKAISWWLMLSGVTSSGQKKKGSR